MHDSTHLTQQDEALRRARHGGPLRLGVLQLALADRLDADHADHPMTKGLAEAQALQVAAATYGEGTYSEQVENTLLRSLPPIRRGDTRDVYAARLRLIAEGATA
ncbi:hypothetical protein EAO71_35160 [Streptomyces sp. ms191]|uniref:hypothetical protein n=1 Tax=Streptomyces sp. ms191 TaxID=1827978 RepID=UPI0011CE82FE|nr:hypothetical protein [Streptomyces sp. ms191]TXS16067.1 hypothetical protein EAO71_35160 [Streptomyces sp. ms191]